MSRGTRATISLKALHHNYQQVKVQAPKAKIWAVVKANAYGHDAALVSQALTEADGYAVSTLAEAKALRDNGLSQPVILLEGVTEAEHWSVAADDQLETVVHCFEQLHQLKTAELTQPLKVWLKVDTGMHRLGFAPADVKQARQQLQAMPLVTMAGLMTHLACADAPDLTVAGQQIALFQQHILPEDIISIGNSAGIFLGETSQGQWVRPGIMLYGASPFGHQTAESLNLKPVMSFTSPVIAIREVDCGESIGYGHCWTAQRKSKIATLAVGYGDGYPRLAPSGTPVHLNGARVAIAGRVSMDMLMVDVTDLTHVDVGDVAELWGEHLPVDEVAKHIGTIGYELLTRLSERVPREAVE